MSKFSQFLTFGIEDDCFALPVERVREVLDVQPYSRLPNAPDYVLGLIDVRGQSLVVLDLRLKFGIQAVPATNRTRIVVVEATIDGVLVGLGLLADCVFAVTDLEGGKLEPAPSIGQRWRADFVIGVGREAGRFVVALDLDRLLQGEPLAARAQAA
jgi:purine-binding chemotaxis protein CheW